MALAVKELPSLDTPLVREPGHWERPFARENGGASHRIHILRGAGGWDWAHLLRAVGGWRVVAAGTLPVDLYATAQDAAAYLADQAKGADGDGIDRLSRAACTQQRPGGDAHLILEDIPERTYCGQKSGTPAVFDLGVKGHAERHCIDCDGAYRAAHFGRTPVVY